MLAPALLARLVSRQSAPGEILGAIDSFQSFRRGDNYGIASFVLSNNTDKPLTSIELNCWVNDDRAHGTKVLVWPSAGPIRAHDQEKFSNVNIGLVGPNPRAACEVTKAE